MKHSSDNKFSTTTTIGIIIALLAVVLFISGIVMFFVSNKSAPQKNPPKTPNSVTAPSSLPGAATDDSAVPSSKPDTTSDLNQPTSVPASSSVDSQQKLMNLLRRGGTNIDTINSNDTKQLIIVDSNGSSAKIMFFEDNGGTWEEDTSLSCDGYIGSPETADENGTMESNNTTPKGLFQIGKPFYDGHTSPSPELYQLQITDNTLLVNDPESQLYKIVKEKTDEIDSYESEKMKNNPSYRYGLVINYNTDNDLVFLFHVGSNPKPGCVSAKQEMVIKYLEKYNSKTNPYILII